MKPAPLCERHRIAVDESCDGSLLTTVGREMRTEPIEGKGTGGELFPRQVSQMRAANGLGLGKIAQTDSTQIDDRCPTSQTVAQIADETSHVGPLVTGDLEVDGTPRTKGRSTANVSDPDRSWFDLKILALAGQRMSPFSPDMDGGNARRRLKSATEKGEKFSVQGLLRDMIPGKPGEDMPLSVTCIGLDAKLKANGVAFRKGHSVITGTCERTDEQQEKARSR